MQLKDHVLLMAQYNQRMNANMYAACESLSGAQLAEDKGAFFGSILGTLNHLLVGDIVWFKRFSLALPSYAELSALDAIPFPDALNAVLFSDFAELKAQREKLDDLVLSFARAVTEEDLQGTVSYKNFKGVPASRVLFSLLMHAFNHQTHHRGQITTLLSQHGVDVGVTDLVTMIPER